MKVPANLSGDRLILDYLTRVTVAGTRYLPKGSRIAFVGNTRNRIEQEIGPNGAADAARVREVLGRLGEPEDLVRAERARLDAERVDRLSRATGASGAEEAPATTGPIEARPINSRWRPATRGRPARQPSGGPDAGPPDRPAGRRGTAGGAKRKGRLGGLLKDRPGTRPEAQPGEQPPPAAAAPSPAGPVPGGTAGPARNSTTGPGPGSTAGPAPGGTARQAPGTAAGPAADGTARQASDAAAGRAADGAAGQEPSGPAGQTAGGPARWPSAGPGGQAPGSTGSPPSPDGMGTQPLSGTGTQAPGRAGAGPGTSAPGEAGSRASTPGPGARGGESRRRQPAGWVTPTAVIPPGAGSRQAGRAGPSGGDTPVHGIPVLRPGPREPREPLTVRSAAAALGRGAARLAVSAARLARRYPLETAAVLLLALGGFILPFPYWLFGGLVGGVLSIWSSMWLARDKWIAVIGPFVIVIAGTILAALFNGAHGDAVTAYPHAFVLYAGDMLRLGNVLCAAYLVVQARRAPQRRLPPWQRQRQRQQLPTRPQR